MKIIPKIIIIAALATPLGASAVTYAVNASQNKKSSPTQITSDGNDYIMTLNDMTLRLDQDELKFTITKGSKTWNSGQVDPSDTNITGYRRAFYESPVTLYSYNSTGGESYFSIFDSAHYEMTTKRFSVEDNKLKARISVLDGSRNKPALKMTFNINYELVEDGLKLYVTDINQDEASSNTLSKLLLYPGFGMSYQHVNGKFLIPDGSGALIDLSKQTHAQSALSLVTYGKDIGISTSNRTYYSGEQLSMPMYSIFDEEKALITTVEGGQEFSELNAKVAGIVDNYNTLYFRFIYKEITYQYLGLSDDNRKAVPQETTNEFTPTLHYHLYDEKLEYYDIAKKYQQYLLANDLLLDEKYGNNKLRLEFLMADNKKALFGKELVKMTSTNFIKDKVEELNENAKDLTVSVKGYTQGGYDNSYPYSFPVEGSTGDYKNLGNYLKNKGIALNFNVDLVRSFKDELNKSAENMSQKLITSTDYVNGTQTKFYRVTPNITTSLLKKYEPNLDKYHGDGFDFTSIGYDLFSTYYHEKNTRTDSIKKYQQAMNEYTHIANVRKPNLYLFKYADNFLDAPTSSSNYMIETESVPFLQMVLSGYKSFYSSPINLNYLGNKQLLQLIDYNVNPSYLLTQEDTVKLIDSPASSYVYSSNYDVWKDDIINSYNVVISILKQVEGSKFLSREEISPLIYKNTYDNGKCIIVNYSSSSYLYEGSEVNALTSEVF